MSWRSLATPTLARALSSTLLPVFVSTLAIGQGRRSPGPKAASMLAMTTTSWSIYQGHTLCSLPASMKKSHVISFYSASPTLLSSSLTQPDWSATSIWLFRCWRLLIGLSYVSILWTRPNVVGSMLIVVALRAILVCRLCPPQPAMGRGSMSSCRQSGRLPREVLLASRSE